MFRLIAQLVAVILQAFRASLSQPGRVARPPGPFWIRPAHLHVDNARSVRTPCPLLS